jgi:hypothetical protein
MLRLAEAQIEQMLAAAEQADKELEILRSQLAPRRQSLPHQSGAETTQRPRLSES